MSNHIDTARPPVLVVGAGPAGLISALTLRKNGVAVRVIECETKFNEGVRGPGIQPRTQELLAFLGVLDDVEAIWVKAHLIAKHGVGKEILGEVPWAEHADESLSTPYRSISDVNQSAFEAVLRKHLEQLGTTVDLGVKLVGIEQTADKVTTRLASGGEEYIEEYDYVVCADGAKGRSRRMLDIPFVGETKRDEAMLLANAECEDVDREHWHTWGEFNDALIGIKPINPAPFVYIQVLGPNVPKPFPSDAEGLQALLNKLSKSTDIKLSNVKVISEWSANIRMAEKFSVGRVFLAGGALRSLPLPRGAQGANTGMQDAANIAWKLSLVIKSLAKPTLLDTYEIERQPVVAEMLKLTTHLHSNAFRQIPDSTLNAAQGESQPEQPKPDQSTPETADPRANDPYWRPKQGLQLGINCRWSPIVLDGRYHSAPGEVVEKKAYGKLGDKLPGADGGETTLFALIAGYARHTVVVFSAAADEELPASLRKYQGHSAISFVKLLPQGSTTAASSDVPAFVDSTGHGYTAYDVEKSAASPTYVVVRPDGMVGAYALSAEQVDREISIFRTLNVRTSNKRNALRASDVGRYTTERIPTESSADDTGVAIVTSDAKILANVVKKQHLVHENYGGIHPYVAPGAVKEALEQANMRVTDVDGIAFTRGPGMTGCLGIGSSAARTLAAALSKPLVGVHHMQAHALTPLLTSPPPERPQFPFLTLLVSGGHTLLLLATSVSEFRILASTPDEAVGRVFDKVSRMLCLPWSKLGPGAALEEFCLDSTDDAAAPTPSVEVPTLPGAMPSILGFSFSGLHSAVERFVTANGGGEALDMPTKRALAREFQRAAVAQLEEKVQLGFEFCRRKGFQVRHVVVSGGVASNSYLRERLRIRMEQASPDVPIALVFPPPALCTDNAAMIAWASMPRFLAGDFDDYSIAIRPKWSIEELSS
ncbi:hypothetical protein EVG20_g8695 [Dentipellis fragilis]|uniref:N(6)-L-threonylcarbamoyladenine synthase n=1 Tax=Dentipellis fragilis TaxID=205917 RepID=A0A4Y9Y4D3_9AGAM|nr:hypothetical protein EVG20_g8695 [Dentipellis fragilis]